MDKTLCLSSGVEMGWETCLSCASSGKQPCGWDYGLLHKVRSHQARTRTGIHVSDVKACLRKAFYEKTLPQEPVFPSDTMYVLLGTMTHSILEDAGHRVWTEVPAQVAFGKYILEGQIDAYHVSTGRIVDYKTTRKINKDKLPYGDHETQVRIYALMLKRLGLAVNSAAIQYIDLMGPAKCGYCKTGRLIPGPEIYVCKNCGREWDTESNSIHSGAVTYEVSLDDLDEFAGTIEGRLAKLNEALTTDIAPQGEPSWLCHFCPFEEGCPDVNR